MLRQVSRNLIILVTTVITLLMCPRSVSANLILKAPVSPLVSNRVTTNQLNKQNNNPNDIPLTTQLYFRDKHILMIGDSLAVGWNGKRNIQKNYPSLLQQYLQPVSLINTFSSSGSEIAGNAAGKPTFDLTNNVSRLLQGDTLKQTDIVIIELGINDLNFGHNNLGYVQQRLQENIQRLRYANPNLKIFGVLPLTSYMQHKTSSYSLLELKQALQKVYQSFGIPTINLKDLGIGNSQADLGDRLVHPTQQTYQKMALALSNWLNANYLAANREHASRQLFISDGWQINEQNQVQYAKHNVLLTDYHKINKKRYYFNPDTKALVTNQNISYLGKHWQVNKHGQLH